MYIVKHFQHCKLLHSVKLPNIISKQFGIFHSFKNFISFSWPSVQTGFSAELAGKSMWPWPSETACRLCFNQLVNEGFDAGLDWTTRGMLLLGRALENLSYFHIYWPNVGLANWISSSSTSTMSYFFNPAQPKTCSTIAGLACQRSGLGLGDAQAYNRRGHWFFGKGLCAWEHCWGMRAVSVEFEQFNSAVNP